MTAPEQSAVEESLGTEFWTQPEDALEEVFSFIYAQALGVLRDEVRERNGTALDYMLAERLAFSYAILRQREADPDPESQLTDRTRRELNKDFFEFTIALKKIWNSEDKTNQSEQILAKVNKAVMEAVKDMPVEQSRVLQLRMADAFDSVGL